jgi:nucleotide-binding universal stress UspA family protein
MSAAQRAMAPDSLVDAFRDVLLPQDESEAALNALRYADGFCVAFAAHLAGLMFGLVPYYPMSLTAAAPKGWIQAQKQASEEAEESERRLKALYAKLAAPNELKRVDAFEQEVGRICARRARTADVTLMGWTPGGGDTERALFEACLFDSGRPVLLVPTGYAFRSLPQRVLVAWNGSREAARALREALPLIRQAKLTRFVTVDAGGSDFGDGDEPIASVTRHIQRHGIAIETKHAHSEGRNVATVLTEEADHFGASIVVLGGYGYVRSGQWVYGGTTRAALGIARTPLFFAN